MRYLFTIFHRLNSGGVRLNNQEIRNCIYTGHFNDMLKHFDVENADWQVVKSRIWGSTSRFRSVEILLRILAFNESLNQYDGNLADFLNKYMHSRAGTSVTQVQEISRQLDTVTNIARSALGDRTSGKLSLAIVEAVLVGVMTNRSVLSRENPSELHGRYLALMSRPAFLEGARYAVSSVENVQSRLREAISTFAS